MTHYKFENKKIMEVQLTFRILSVTRAKNE